MRSQEDVDGYWHLLVNGEKYVEEGFEMTVRRRNAAYGSHVPLEEIVEVLRSAACIVTDPVVRSKRFFIQ